MSPTQIRAAVTSLLAEPRYRQRARTIQTDFARHNAPCAAALLLEQLAQPGSLCYVQRRTPMPERSRASSLRHC